VRNRLIGRAAGRIPGLRRLPVFKLLAMGEIALAARDHLGRLEPEERRRLVALVRAGRGRRANLSGTDREELGILLAKLEPRAFAGSRSTASPPSRSRAASPRRRGARTAEPATQRVSAGSAPASTSLSPR
jgi:hypothetical protein